MIMQRSQTYTNRHVGDAFVKIDCLLALFFSPYITHKLIIIDIINLEYFRPKIQQQLHTFKRCSFLCTSSVGWNVWYTLALVVYSLYFLNQTEEVTSVIDHLISIKSIKLVDGIYSLNRWCYTYNIFSWIIIFLLN